MCSRSPGGPICAAGVYCGIWELLRLFTTNPGVTRLSGDCDDASGATSAGTGEAGTRALTPAAQRALQEAAERRARRQERERRERRVPEHGGRDGPDPVRYGDWEKGGIASDF